MTKTMCDKCGKELEPGFADYGSLTLGGDLLFGFVSVGISFYKYSDHERAYRYELCKACKLMSLRELLEKEVQTNVS